MRRIVLDANPAPIKALEPPSSDISLDELLDKTRLILYREIKNLLEESSAGLLSKDSSTSLVNYAKLLKDLKKAEEDAGQNLSDEELEELAKAARNEDKPQ